MLRAGVAPGRLLVDHHATDTGAMDGTLRGEKILVSDYTCLSPLRHASLAVVLELSLDPGSRPKDLISRLSTLQMDTGTRSECCSESSS